MCIFMLLCNLQLADCSIRVHCTVKYECCMGLPKQPYVLYLSSLETQSNSVPLVLMMKADVKHRDVMNVLLGKL